MEEAYAFDDKNGRVIIGFTLHFPVTYCTISVIKQNRKITHYHDGIVYNPSDHYNPRTGRFLAFKKALRHRWIDRHDKYGNYEGMWKAYHRKWSHFLSAMMDGKVMENDDSLNYF